MSTITLDDLTFDREGVYTDFERQIGLPDRLMYLQNAVDKDGNNYTIEYGIKAHLILDESGYAYRQENGRFLVDEADELELADHCDWDDYKIIKGD